MFPEIDSFSVVEIIPLRQTFVTQIIRPSMKYSTLTQEEATGFRNDPALADKLSPLIPLIREVLLVYVSDLEHH